MNHDKDPVIKQPGFNGNPEFFFGFSNGKLHPGVFALVLVFQRAPRKWASYLKVVFFNGGKTNDRKAFKKTDIFFGGCQNPVRLST